MAIWDLFRLLWSSPDQPKPPAADRPAAEPADTPFPVLLVPVGTDPGGSITQALANALGGSSTGLTVIQGRQPLTADTTPTDLVIPDAFSRICTLARRAAEAADALAVVWAEPLPEGGLRVFFLPTRYDGDPASGTLLAGDMVEVPFPLGPTQELIAAGALCALQLRSDAQRRRRLERLRSAGQAVDRLLQTSPSPLSATAISGASLFWAAMLGEMGMRTGEQSIIARAAELCRAAMSKGKGNLSPVQLAAGRTHLGDLTAALGDHEGSAAKMADAVTHYRAAASILTIEAFRDENALIMAQMGRCLHRQADLDAKTETIREAVQCYRQAAQVWTKAARPQRWAELQNGIGALLTRMGELTGRGEAFERAAKVFEGATDIWTAEKEPRRWAGLQNNIGACRFALGKLTQELPPLRSATDCFRSALTIYQGLGMTRNIHVTQKNLGRVERLIAVLESRAA